MKLFHSLFHSTTIQDAIALSLLLTSSALAQSNTSREVQCFGKIDHQIQSFKTRLASSGRLVYWNESKIVDTDSQSYFAPLADLSKFEIEGAASFTGKNQYRILSVTNKIGSIDIGVSKDFSTGFYNVRKSGSNSESKRVPLVCQILPKMPRW